MNTTPSIKKTAPKRKLIEQVDSSENDQKDVKQGKLKGKTISMQIVRVLKNEIFLFTFS